MRASTTTTALLTGALLAGALAGPATAAERTTLQLGGAAAQQLTGQKARFAAASGATATTKRVALPVRRVTVKGSTATISHRGTLTLRVGKRAVRLADPQLVVGTSSRLTARIGARRYTVATLFTNQRVRRVTADGAVLDRAPATLTPAAAKQLRTRLKLRRTPKGRLGTISVATGGVTLGGGTEAPPSGAVPDVVVPPLVVPPVPGGPAPTPDPDPVDPGPVDPGPVDPGDPGDNPYAPVDDSLVCPTVTNGLTTGTDLGVLPPAPAGSTAVSAGSAVWGFAAMLRSSFAAYGPTVPASFNRWPGATCDEPYRAFVGGVHQRSDDRFGIPVGDGWYDAASGKAAVRFEGGFRIGYHIGGWAGYAPATYVPGPYRGLWASFVDAQVTLDGTTGTLSALSDAGGNTPWRYAARARRAFGALNLTGIAPDTSVAGQVTWHDVPVTLTAEGADIGIEYFSPGDALDPITITVRTAD